MTLIPSSISSIADLIKPTNHLDLHALVWLELWLTQNYQGERCVDAVSTHTALLSCDNGRYRIIIIVINTNKAITTITIINITIIIIISIIVTIINNYHVGILLVVSHDQVFLDSICTDIIELKSQLAGQSKSCLTHYSGDYSSYTNTVEEHRVAQHRLRVAFEKERDKLKEFIARDGKKYDNPAHQSQRKVS